MQVFLNRKFKTAADRVRKSIRSKKGETLVEIMVAFVVLLIALAAFSQIIAFTTTYEARAIDERKFEDSRMGRLMEAVASGEAAEGVTGPKTGLTDIHLSSSAGGDTLTYSVYTVTPEGGSEDNAEAYIVFE